jgi:protease I
MLKLVRDLFTQKKPVAAICHGPWVLCSVRLPQGDSVIRGKRLTCFHSIKDDIENAGGTVVNETVVVDGNLITSRKPDDLPAFVVAIIEQLHKG